MTDIATSMAQEEIRELRAEVKRLQDYNEWLIAKLKELRAEIELVSK